jgi:predicted nucleic acid-binding protein
MSVDPRMFHLINVIDTCSIWNILSSRNLFSLSLHAKSNFTCTEFVFYECLYKPRKDFSEEDSELKRRFEQASKRGEFKIWHIEIDDLNDLAALNHRKKLSKGELSSMIFAKRINQAFLTDDQGARKLASQCLPTRMVQTTPHLFGWLVYIGLLYDHDKDAIIKEHEFFKRPLKKYFEQVYAKALEYKLAYDPSMVKH